MAFFIQSRQELLHALDAIVLSRRCCTLFHLIIFQVGESFDHETRTRTKMRLELKSVSCKRHCYTSGHFVGPGVWNAQFE